MDGKEVYTGTAHIANVGEPVAIVSVPLMDDDYIVTGWMDLSGMASDTIVTVCFEFYIVEGQQQPTRLCASYYGLFDAGPLHIRPLYMPRWARLTITVTLASGSPLNIPYWIVAVKPDIGVKAWLMRRWA